MWKLGGGGLPTRPSPLTNKLEAVAAAAAKLIGPILRINGEGKQRVDVGRVRREAAMNHGRADATQDVTLGACKTHQVPRRGPARGRTPPSVECEEWWGGDARPERLDADPLGRAGTTCEPQTLVRGSRRKKMDGPYALGDGSCHCLELVCPWRVASGPPATLPRSQAFGGCASTSSCAGRSYMCQPACLTLTRRAATPFPLNVARRRLPLAGNTGVRK